jgi:hypothetical protein
MSAEKIIFKDQNYSTSVVVEAKEKIIPKRVDINDLLSRVRKEEKHQQKTNLVFFGLFSALVFVVIMLLSF